MNAAWEIRALEALDARDPSLPSTISGLFRQCFDSGDWSDGAVRQRLANASVLGLLRGEGGEPRGYAMYEVPVPMLRGLRVLWESSIAVVPTLRGRGFSTDVLRLILANERVGPIGWLAGRTQNPVVFQRYGRLGELFPFDCDYTREEGPELLRYLTTHVAELGCASSIDPETGICARAYREGRLAGHAAPDPEDSRERQLADWGFSRERGDAVIVACRLRRLT